MLRGQTGRVARPELPEVPLIGIVDDDIAMREAFEDFLHSAGLTCAIFPSAVDFLEVYAPGRFAAIITDLKMPGLDGLQLLERVQALGNAPPVIIVTSSRDMAARARAVEGGAAAYLTKPVASDGLLQLLDTLLEQGSPKRGLD